MRLARARAAPRVESIPALASRGFVLFAALNLIESGNS
jgi:hypothetical protein